MASIGSGIIAHHRDPATSEHMLLHGVLQRRDVLPLAGTLVARLVPTYGVPSPMKRHTVRTRRILQWCACVCVCAVPSPMCSILLGNSSAISLTSDFRVASVTPLRYHYRPTPCQLRARGVHVAEREALRGGASASAAGTHRR